MTAWAMSPAYGRAVALGPAQRDVLEVVMRLTAGGRRPELTLGRLAVLSGRPVSSVHDALGRLRALGLVGVSARMGRHGGHRLWRVRQAADRALDPGKRRVAIARLVARWWRRTIEGPSARRQVDPTAGAVSPRRPAVNTYAGDRHPAEAGTPAGVPDDRRLTGGAASPPAAPPVPRQTPPDEREPFGTRLRRAAEQQGLAGLIRHLDEWESER